MEEKAKQDPEFSFEETIKGRIDLLLSERAQRNPYKRFTILTYQLADVGRCLRYMEIYPDDRESYRTYLKTALADTIIQVLAMI